MTPLLLTFAGLLGLVIGSFLNVVIARVPAGVSLLRESQCPRCAASIRPWQNVPVISWLLLRAKCAGCGEPISARYPLVELATGLLFVATAWWVLALDTVSIAGGIVIFVAYAWFAAISIALTMIDLDTRRLPNVIVLPSLALLTVLLVIAAFLTHDFDALLRAAIGAAALFGFYALLGILRPGGMGGGDIKLAAVVGLMLGWIGWGPLIVGAFAAFVLGGIIGIALMLGRRATRRSAIPFGPWMLAGAWIGIFAGAPSAASYLSLIGVNA